MLLEKNPGESDRTVFARVGLVHGRTVRLVVRLHIFQAEHATTEKLQAQSQTRDHPEHGHRNPAFEQEQDEADELPDVREDRLVFAEQVQDGEVSDAGEPCGYRRKAPQRAPQPVRIPFAIREISVDFHLFDTLLVLYCELRERHAQDRRLQHQFGHIAEFFDLIVVFTQYDHQFQTVFRLYE